MTTEGVGKNGRTSEPFEGPERRGYRETCSATEQSTPHVGEEFRGVAGALSEAAQP